MLWGAFVEPRRDIYVVLAGGGLIVAKSAHIDKEVLHGDSNVFDRFALPIELVAGIVFRPPLDHAAADRLTSRILSAAGQNDRLLLDNGDELTGTIVGLEEEHGAQACCDCRPTAECWTSRSSSSWRRCSIRR